ncbi:putative family 17 glucosidase SCW4 [Wickerhamomyces ciferrii]|uniref:Family 17 glucosidase SCW4 n=1 Tax=Wickerhamomyces ciferrii (strain ATCC 14091 / BCRC 22168 / CBS 111 / JCM 3599 / NBRC 0793 / NRRL Y-1031 F-60-10) TaxID=1206466 RepID=K0KHZ4_WICCF|nr:putative family 17 glucosidase SCW4 [Wickerhamomyces ciferrii]CCH41772.1 putative family 17 glucosidase SCW4 [Wickerhamomyces ciferrii]
MKLSTVLLSTLASLVVAQPAHQHHEHKRDAAVQIVTQYQTQIVTQGVTATVGAGDAQQSQATSQATSQAPASQSSAQPQGEESGAAVNKNIVSDAKSAVSSFFGGNSQTTTLSSTQGGASSSASPSSTQGGSESSSTSSSSSSPSSSGGSGSSGENFGAKGITYSPYTNSGSCKDASTIKSDVKKLSGFDIIRLYDVDCSGVESVMSAKGSNQKIFAGIYHVDAISDGVKQLAEALNNNWDDIYAVSIGNELVNSGEKQASEIKSLVDEAKSALKSAGYTGKVVSVDTLVAVQNNDELCDASDFIAVNSHPFWDGNVEPSGSGDFLKKQISNIKSQCGGKDVLITETGWPTQGQTFQKAVPSKDNQKEALQSIGDSCGDQVILFTVFDDFWKQAGSYGVEQYWGIFSDN